MKNTTTICVSILVSVFLCLPFAVSAQTITAVSGVKVVDANGAFVGIPMGDVYSDEGGYVHVAVNNQLVALRLVWNSRYNGIAGAPPGFYFQRPQLQFTTTDCSGTPYLPAPTDPLYEAPPGSLHTAWIGRTLYVASGDKVDIQVAANRVEGYTASGIGPAGCEFVLGPAYGSSSYPLTPLATLGPTQFVEPFHLEMSAGTGDANANGVVDPADIMYLINFLFAGGPKP